MRRRRPGATPLPYPRSGVPSKKPHPTQPRVHAARVGYVLEALIVRGAPAWPAPVTRLGRLVPLRSLDGVPLGLLPLTEEVQSRLEIDSASAPVLGFLELRQPVADLAAEASLTAPVAYVNAEYC
jgi:hypothetical protein